jgi:hypothetical protein
MRIRWLVALAAMFTLGAAANAQPVKAEPTIELRLRSVNDLIHKAEYVAGLAGKEELLKQFQQIVKQLTADGKGLEGIETKQPFGLYATLSSDVVNSPFTVMVPIADKERFLSLLKDRLNITPEKAADGTYKADVPIINEVYLRFANDYVYIARAVKDLDPKSLPTPKEFFAKEVGAVGSLLVRFDKIPAELKTFIIGQLELGVAEQRRKNGENEPAAQKAVLDWLAENFTGGIKTLFDDAKELNVRVFIDEKADDLSAELTLTAKSGSVLSKNIASLAGKTSVPAAIVGNTDTVARVTAKAGLPDSVKKELAKVVDAAIEDIVKKAGDNDKEPLERLLKTLAPTLKSGEIDSAVAVTGPDAKGRHTLIAATAVKEGKDIEKLLKDFAPHLGQAADIDLDVEKIGDFNLHSIAFKDLPEPIEKVFGTKKLWLAISEDYIALSVEPDGTALRAGLKARPVSVPAFSAEVAFAKLVPVMGHQLKPDEIKAMLKDAFGDASPTGKDTLSITITGGNQLTVKAKLKGKGVRLLMTLDQFKIR